MALPTTTYTGLVGTFFINNAPPTTAELGKAAEAGMCYIDSDGSNKSFCCYDGSVWKCTVLSAAQPTTTSTSTTTSTTTTKSTSTTTT